MKYESSLEPYIDDKRTISCQELCSGNHECCCEIKKEFGKSHDLHICDNSNCICHSRERYEGPEKLESDKWILVAKVGHLNLVQYTGKVGFIPLKPKDVSYDEYQDILRARGLKKIPDSVVPEIYNQLDLESLDVLTDLMEQE